MQIIFEAVEVTNDEVLAKYPMGVKVSHRAFAKDKVFILKRWVQVIQIYIKTEVLINSYFKASEF